MTTVVFIKTRLASLSLHALSFRIPSLKMINFNLEPKIPKLIFKAQKLTRKRFKKKTLLL